MATNERPMPIADELSRPYWEAARAGRLSLQRCKACRRFQHPPQVYCRACGGSDYGFEQVSGDATVYSSSIVRESITPGLDAPYTVIIAELIEQEGLRMVANCAGEVALSQGQKLRATFERVSDVIVLPQFSPAD